MLGATEPEIALASFGVAIEQYRFATAVARRADDKGILIALARP